MQNESKLQNQSGNETSVFHVALGLRNQYIVSYIMCLKVKGKVYVLEKEMKIFCWSLLSFYYC